MDLQYFKILLKLLKAVNQKVFHAGNLNFCILDLTLSYVNNIEVSNDMSRLLDYANFKEGCGNCILPFSNHQLKNHLGIF